MAKQHSRLSITHEVWSLEAYRHPYTETQIIDQDIHFSELIEKIVYAAHVEYCINLITVKAKMVTTLLPHGYIFPQIPEKAPKVELDKTKWVIIAFRHPDQQKSVLYRQGLTLQRLLQAVIDARNKGANLMSIRGFLGQEDEEPLGGSFSEV